MEIVLSPEDQQMLDEKIANGRFSSADQAIAAALDLLRRREELSLEEELQLVQVGIDQIERGEYRTISSRQEMEAFIEEIRQRSADREGDHADS